MPSIEEHIQEIEDEIRRTPYNKASMHHIGRLKAKLAKLRDDLEKRRGSGGGGKGYSVRKSGHATVALVGFPSVGKSTLLNRLTDADSEVGTYDFTTLDVVPGTMFFQGAKIQVLDLPGLIRGASKGKGRGREVLSAVRTADLVLLILDVFSYRVEILVRELEFAGLRLNARAPDIVVRPKKMGGLTINTTIPLTKIDEDTIKDTASTFGLVNADIVIRQDIVQDQLIDHLAGNRIYVPAITLVNKTDLIDTKHKDKIEAHIKGLDALFISAKEEEGIEELKDRLFSHLRFIRLYLRPQGGEPDFKEPLVVKGDSDIGTVCDSLHRDFRRKFRYAMVWGKSAKFPGQIVGRSHKLEDEDVVTLILRK